MNSSWPPDTGHAGMSYPVTGMIGMLRLVLTALPLLSCADGMDGIVQKGVRASIDDSVVEGKVKTALLQDPAVSGLVVTVESSRGAVRLGGFVNSAAEKRRAVEVARSVEGVGSVKDNMVVK